MWDFSSGELDFSINVLGIKCVSAIKDNLHVFYIYRQALFTSHVIGVYLAILLALISGIISKMPKLFEAPDCQPEYNSLMDIV